MRNIPLLILFGRWRNWGWEVFVLRQPKQTIWLQSLVKYISVLWSPSPALRWCQDFLANTFICTKLLLSKLQGDAADKDVLTITQTCDINAENNFLYY